MIIFKVRARQRCAIICLREYPALLRGRQQSREYSTLLLATFR